MRAAAISTLLGVGAELGADGDDDEADSEATQINLLIAKQRNGPTGDVRLTFLKGFTRFENAAKISSDDVPQVD